NFPLSPLGTTDSSIASVRYASEGDSPFVSADEKRAAAGFTPSGTSLPGFAFAIDHDHPTANIARSRLEATLNTRSPRGVTPRRCHPVLSACGNQVAISCAVDRSVSSGEFADSVRDSFSDFI